MAQPLDTVQDYVAKARELLQDTVDTPYRYSTPDLLSALSLSFGEAKLLRPDLFIVTPLQNFTTSDATPVTFDPMYRIALVYYMCGMAQLRDDEETQDQRAAAFLNMFRTKLVSGI
jgi:hypothetical protein